VGAVLPSFSSMSEPSAQELAALEDSIQKLGVKAIFVGNTVNPALASRIAQDTGVRLAPFYSDSLSEPGGPAATYLDFMHSLVDTIIGALQ
jgi:zinc/manganese transport system substrate-binding protein